MAKNLLKWNNEIVSYNGKPIVWEEGSGGGNYPTRGLISRYTFEDSLNDSFGTNNGWVASGLSSTWSYDAGGKIGKGWKGGAADDSNGYIKNVTNTAIMNLVAGTNSFSTSIWIKITNSNQDLATPFQWRSTQFTGTAYNWSFGGSAYKPSGDINGGPFLSSGQYYAADMRDNVWHHYVHTFNGTIQKLYIDTVERISASRGANDAEYYWHSFSQQGSWIVQGIMDQLYYYNVCLTTDEISSLYFGGTGV